MFTWRWGTSGRWGNPLRQGKPPVYITYITRVSSPTFCSTRPGKQALRVLRNLVKALLTLPILLDQGSVIFVTYFYNVWKPFPECHTTRTNQTPRRRVVQFKPFHLRSGVTIRQKWPARSVHSSDHLSLPWFDINTSHLGQKCASGEEWIVSYPVNLNGPNACLGIYLDHFTFLRNCPPTPPLSQH